MTLPEGRGMRYGLIKSGFWETIFLYYYLKREKKSLIPTDTGIELVTILPQTLNPPN